ncbi:hypothetical protein QEH56_08450 [Pelagicoccus enzymogenes]|uniref:hypothetical protein n=1 Tax=Pelagicoccus enzymogenes TaxID=2773457 RepID=UPI00280FB03F|nr:hypothetical protein [Pelagicoccus enzymogenes]MDQ8198172.1 hypothetical protein [Pelagicoccus enzymogenes]
MCNEFVVTKIEALERAWKLLQEQKYDACQETLLAMEPESKDCEEYHATWLSTLIYRQRWDAVVAYARPLVERHGGYCASFWFALVTGLSGQGKLAEAYQAVMQALSHWPSNSLLKAMEQSLDNGTGEGAR